MAGDAGELKAVVSAETSDFIAKMNELAQKVGETSDKTAEKFGAIGDAIEGISGALAGLGIGAGFAEIGAAALEAAEKIEKLNAAFENLAGATEENIQNWEEIKALELHSLFDFEDTLGPAAKHMLELGESTETVKDRLTALVGAATAMKETPQWIEAVSTSLAQMDQRTEVSKKAMLQFAAEGIPAWQALAEHMGTDIAGAMDAVKEKMVSGKDVSDAVTEYLAERYGDAADRIQGSWKLAWHNLGEAGEEFQQKVGGAIGNLLQTLAPLITDLTNAVNGLATWFTNLTEPMQTAIIAFGAALAIIPAVAGAIGALDVALTAAAATMGVAIAPMLGIVAAAAAVVAGLTVAGIWIAEHWEPITKTVSQAWEGLTELWGGVWNGIVGWFQGIIASLESIFAPFSLVVDGIKAIFNGLKALWKAEWDGIVELFQQAWGVIAGAATMLWDTLKTVFGGLASLLEKLPGGDKIAGLAQTWKDANAELDKNKSAAKDAADANDKARAASIDSAKQEERAATAAAEAKIKAENAAKAAAAEEKKRAEEAKKAADEEKASLEAVNRAYEQIKAVSPQLAAEFQESFGGADKGAAQLESTFLTLAQHGVVLTDSFKEQVLQAAALSQAYKDLGMTSGESLEQAAAKADAAFEAVSASGKASAADLEEANQKVLAAHQKVADFLNADLTRAYNDGKITADEYYDAVVQRAQDTVTAAQAAADAGTGTLEAVAAAEKELNDARVAQVTNSTTEMETAYTALGQKTQFMLDETAAKFQDYADKVKAAEGGDTITAINAQIAALEAQKTALENSGQPTDDLTDKIKALKKAIEDLKSPTDQLNDAFKTLGLQTTKDLTEKTNLYADAVAKVRQAQIDGNATAADVYAAQTKLYDQTAKQIEQLNQPLLDAYKQGKITSQEYWDAALKGAQDFLAQIKLDGTETPQQLEKIHAAQKIVADYANKDMVDAWHTLGVKSGAEMQTMTDNATEAFNKIKNSAETTAPQMQAAWLTATKAVYDQIVWDGGDITTQQANEYAKQKQNLTDHLDWTTSQWGTTYAGVKSAVSGAFDDLVDKLVTGKGSFKDIMVGLGQDLLKAMVDGFVAPFKKAVSEFVANELADLISGLGKVAGFKMPSFGGGGGGGGGLDTEGNPITGGGGGGGGGGAGIGGSMMSGAMGWASIGMQAGTMVSSIISNFQQAKMETTLNAIELNTRLVAMFIGGLNDGGVQTWTMLTAYHTHNLLDMNGWMHDAWVELLGGKDTLLGILGGDGWIHDYFANGLGPAVDRISDNSGLIVQSLGGITAGLQNLTVTINAQGITTREAAQQLSDQIAKALSQQMAGSSLRT